MTPTRAEPTKAEQMKAIVLAVGGKWHKLNRKTYVCSCGYECLKDPCPGINPDPDDLNALFWYAKKLDKHDIFFFQALASPCEFCDIDADRAKFRGQGEEPSDALRSALYQSITDRR